MSTPSLKKIHSGKNKRDLLSYNQRRAKRMNNQLLRKEKRQKRKEKKMNNLQTERNKSSKFPSIFNFYSIN